MRTWGIVLKDFNIGGFCYNLIIKTRVISSYNDFLYNSLDHKYLDV